MVAENILKTVSQIEIAKMPKLERTKFVNSLSGFKSVNLVGTVNKKGVTNLSIVSSVIHLGANPALMGFIIRPIIAWRDTYHNIMETGHFTFNHISPDFFKKAHQCSARYDRDVSEFDAVGLTPEFTKTIRAPYVSESNLKIGLHFADKKEIELNNTILMIGEIKEVIYPENCLQEDGFLDIEKAGTITCSSLDSYHKTQRITRLSYAKPDRNLWEL